MKNVVAFLLLLVLPFVSNAQLLQEIDSLELKPWQMKKLGKNAQKIGDWYSAIDYYTKYLEFKPDKNVFKYRLATVYREARNYGVAQEMYLKLYEEMPTKFPLASYYAALMKKMNSADYSGSLADMMSFKKVHKTVAGEKPFRKFLKNEMIGSEMAPDWIKDSLKVIITHMDTTINHAHVEFNPIFTSDTSIIYASLKSNKINKN